MDNMKKEQGFIRISTRPEFVTLDEEDRKMKVRCTNCGGSDIGYNMRFEQLECNHCENIMELKDEKERQKIVMETPDGGKIEGIYSSSPPLNIVYPGHYAEVFLQNDVNNEDLPTITSIEKITPPIDVKEEERFLDLPFSMEDQHLKRKCLAELGNIVTNSNYPVHKVLIPALVFSPDQINILFTIEMETRKKMNSLLSELTKICRHAVCLEDVQDGLTTTGDVNKAGKISEANDDFTFIPDIDLMEDEDIENLSDILENNHVRTEKVPITSSIIATADIDSEGILSISNKFDLVIPIRSESEFDLELESVFDWFFTDLNTERTKGEQMLSYYIWNHKHENRSIPDNIRTELNSEGWANKEYPYKFESHSDWMENASIYIKNELNLVNHGSKELILLWKALERGIKNARDGKMSEYLNEVLAGYTLIRALKYQSNTGKSAETILKDIADLYGDTKKYEEVKEVIKDEQKILKAST